MKKPSPALRRLLESRVKHPSRMTDEEIAACREYGIKVPKDVEDGS